MNINERVTVGFYVDVDNQVIQHAGYASYRAVGITLNGAATDGDVVNCQVTFVSVAELTDGNFGFQFDGHTGLTGHVTHGGVVKRFQISLSGKRSCSNGRCQCDFFQAFHNVLLIGTVCCYFHLMQTVWCTFVSARLQSTAEVTECSVTTFT